MGVKRRMLVVQGYRAASFVISDFCCRLCSEAVPNYAVSWVFLAPEDGILRCKGNLGIMGSFQKRCPESVHIQRGFRV